MKSIDEVFKMLFKSIESNTKEDTCLSGFLPSQEFYLKDLDYGSVVDTDGTQVFCMERERVRDNKLKQKKIKCKFVDC